MFAAIAGVSAPPPFGGSQRTVVVRADPRPAARLQPLRRRRGQRPHGRQHDRPIRATSATTTRMPLVPDQRDGRASPRNSATIAVKPGVFLRDVVPPRPGHGQAADRGRHRHPDRLRPGQRQAGRLHPRHQAGRRLDARRGQQRPGRTCRRCRRVLPDDIKVSFEFDQSPYVTELDEGRGVRGAARRRCWSA